LKINLTGKSQTASRSGTCDFKNDSMDVKTDRVRKNKPAFTLSKPNIIRDEFGWPPIVDEAGKTYDFKLQLTVQYSSLSQTDLTRETVIRAQQTNSATFITTSGDFAPYH
jgi:hypothetical protein